MDHRLSKYTYKMSKYCGQHGGKLADDEVTTLVQLLTAHGYSINRQELFPTMAQQCLTKISQRQSVVPNRQPPQSVVDAPQSVVHAPQSVVHAPQSVVDAPQPSVEIVKQLPYYDKTLNRDNIKVCFFSNHDKPPISDNIDNYIFIDEKKNYIFAATNQSQWRQGSEIKVIIIFNKQYRPPRWFAYAIIEVSYNYHNNEHSVTILGNKIYKNIDFEENEYINVNWNNTKTNMHDDILEYVKQKYYFRTPYYDPA
jgi:hypothetical protein